VEAERTGWKEEKCELREGMGEAEGASEWDRGRERGEMREEWTERVSAEG